MQEITLKLTTITPLMLGGENGAKGSPELRAPSFRGVMRYWFRAAAGAIIGDENPIYLQSMETAVFGNAETGSPIVVHIPQLQKSLNSQSHLILPHHPESKGQRKAFSEGQSFELILRARFPIEPDIWQAALASLELGLAFGGLGLRSRRGYGTLKITSVKEQQLPIFKDDLESYCREITGSMASALRSLAGRLEIPILPEPPAGPCQYPCASKSAEVLISNVRYHTAMEAVIGFMQVVPQNPSLGRISRPRQASPLWVRPVQMDKSDFCLLFTLLPSIFPGANYPWVINFLNTKFPGTSLALEGWNI
jgi:CRISPR-associated protein Cmr1